MLTYWWLNLRAVVGCDSRLVAEFVRIILRRDALQQMTLMGIDNRHGRLQLPFP